MTKNIVLQEYKLSCVLYGHSLDVRSVSSNQRCEIVSGSRDKTCKYWIHLEGLDRLPRDLSEGRTYTGHKNYVSSVCFLKPTPDHPMGLIASGGNDSLINIYSLDSPEPVITLQAHSNTVCNITNAYKPGYFLSSSWDCTAKLWSYSGQSNLKEMATFSGHQAAVWAVVQLPNGNVVTGSADKDVIIWSENGQKMKICKGHTDCVRGLVVLKSNTFLSVSNDASVKRWSFDGELLETLYEHGNYIYGVAANDYLGDNDFVTCGEDRVVKVWHEGKSIQTITLPAQSVWSVCCMANGDIVTGSSDGVVRIFTQDSHRFAEETTIKQFEEEVSNWNTTASQEIGGVKISDLPGKEVLYEPGKSDGQTKLIREGAGVMCYSWSASEGTWNKVGDVMGAAGGTQATSGKTLYEGREYDFVFSVDIEDGKPPLKLPYNRDQDPWFAAQTFIHKNQLPQVYLDQVANFIITNAGAAQLPPPSQSSDFVDPFTGGSRYMPGSASTNTGIAGSNLDPFTGGSSYTTASSAPKPAPVSNLPPNADPFTGGSSYTTTPTQHIQIASTNYFPQLTHLRFDQGNVSVILDKLREFNKKTGDNNCKIDEELLEGVVKLAIDSPSDGIFIDVLLQLLNWPHDIVFPVLDITRLAIRHAENNILLCSDSNGEFLIQLLRKYILADIVANKMLSLRILCNMFSHSPGENLILSQKDNILSDISSLGSDLNKNCQIALSTLLLNLSISLVKTKDNHIKLLADVITNTILKLNDSEGEFRSFVALGTLLSQVEPTSKHLIIENIPSIPKLKEKLSAILNTNSTDPSHLKYINCARQLNNLFA